MADLGASSDRNLILILVTGSDGQVGRSLCAVLRRENLAFVGADLNSPEPCDVTDREALDRLFRARRIDRVIHLAAVLPSACRRNPSEAARVNVMGSVNVLEAAGAFGVQRLVFGSSISAYASAGGDMDVYGAGKQYIEAYGRTMAGRTSMAFHSLRIATVVGPGARQTASPWRSDIFEKLGSGRLQQIAIPLRPAEVLSLVYVEDVARMLLLLATWMEVPSPIYDTPAENWSMQDLKRTIETADPNMEIDLDQGAGKFAPPLADGARFAADFGWRAVPLAERLAGRLLE